MNADFQLELYKYAQSRNKRVTELTAMEITVFSAKLRSPSQLIQDGYKAASSVIVTSLKMRNVPLTVYIERKQACKSNACKKCLVLKDESIVCLVCGCAGTMMEAALHDSREACRLPAHLRLWDQHDSE